MSAPAHIAAPASHAWGEYLTPEQFDTWIHELIALDGDEWNATEHRHTFTDPCGRLLRIRNATRAVGVRRAELRLIAKSDPRDGHTPSEAITVAPGLGVEHAHEHLHRRLIPALHDKEQTWHDHVDAMSMRNARQAEVIVDLARRVGADAEGTTARSVVNGARVEARTTWPSADPDPTVTVSLRNLSVTQAQAVMEALNATPKESTHETDTSH